MARQVGSERSIPHLRDIFGFGAWEEKERDKTPVVEEQRSQKKKKHRRDSSGARTLTEKDVKHLERHLSMKKTIRKKMMRDLQQAFVEDPNEFRVEDISPEQLKAEINIQSLSFGGPQKKAAAPEATFLDMLRGGAPTPRSNNQDDDDDDGDSGHVSDADGDDGNYNNGSSNNTKTSFWRRFTIKGRNKR